jgi:membrane fusion protein, multidrug efflux system
VNGASDAPAPPSQNGVKNQQKRKRWLLSLGALFLLIGICWFFYWLLIGRFYVYTEDAYVTGNQVPLTPQVSSGIKAIYADETDLVQKGQLVVELDRSNFEIRVEELKKTLANQVREVASLFQDVEAKKASVILRAAELRQAELDYKHREPLVKTGAVSVEEFETFQTNVVVAAAALCFAEKDLEAAKTLVEGTTVETHPRVQAAVWDLRQSYLDLIRCQILSPVTGFMAARSAQVGDQVKIGDTLLFIVPLDYTWIEANYKETQLKNVRIGQSVHFTADLYGRGITYHGKVVGFQPGSGNAFSLLPPENAAGNWIKIIQRVPVRVSIEPEELLQNPLFLGLSTRVTTDIHDTSGKKLAQVPTFSPIYTTEIYSKQLEEMAALDPLIHDLIENNKYPQCSTK